MKNKTKNNFSPFPLTGTGTAHSQPLYMHNQVANALWTTFPKIQGPIPYIRFSFLFFRLSLPPELVSYRTMNLKKKNIRFSRCTPTPTPTPIRPT